MSDLNSFMFELSNSIAITINFNIIVWTAILLDQEISIYFQIFPTSTKNNCLYSLHIASFLNGGNNLVVCVDYMARITIIYPSFQGRLSCQKKHNNTCCMGNHVETDIKSLIIGTTFIIFSIDTVSHIIYIIVRLLILSICMILWIIFQINIFIFLYLDHITQ